mmetsp:Transcript_9694/g.34445  ORF Transcript_9694/g.34445 Transcript_9694/m.34445 type:complete len:220 (+) Transcript_9694:51-710(+)
MRHMYPARGSPSVCACVPRRPRRTPSELPPSEQEEDEEEGASGLQCLDCSKADANGPGKRKACRWPCAEYTRGSSVSSRAAKDLGSERPPAPPSSSAPPDARATPTKARPPKEGISAMYAATSSKPAARRRRRPLGAARLQANPLDEAMQAPNCVESVPPARRLLTQSAKNVRLQRLLLRPLVTPMSVPSTMMASKVPEARPRTASAASHTDSRQRVSA